MSSSKACLLQSNVSKSHGDALLNWHMSPPNCQWPHLAVFFSLLLALGTCYHFVFSLPLSSPGLDQPGALEMYRDPQWSDISWNIKQEHKGVKWRFKRHNPNAALPVKKKKKTSNFILALIKDLMLSVICVLTKNINITRYAKKGKIMKAWATYVH